MYLDKASQESYSIHSFYLRCSKIGFPVKFWTVSFQLDKVYQYTNTAVNRR